MHPCRVVPTLLLVLGCGGETHASSDAGSARGVGSIASFEAATPSSESGVEDGSSNQPNIRDAGAGPDAFATDVPDAFPDDCATAFPVLAQYFAAGTPTCRLSPGNVACESTNDCVVYLIGLCSGIDAVGVNRDASLICASQNCPMPPPPGSGVESSPGSIRTEDCRVVEGRQYVGVACVNNECLTYAAGP
jgi:hypothetical protein